jgi:hypothetical protein
MQLISAQRLERGDLVRICGQIWTVLLIRYDPSGRFFDRPVVTLLLSSQKDQMQITVNADWMVPYQDSMPISA